MAGIISGPESEDGLLRTDHFAGRYFGNLESYPGQIFSLPETLTAKREALVGRSKAVRAGRHAQRTVEHIRGGIESSTDMVVGPRLFVQPQPDWDILTGFTTEEKKRFVNQATAQFNNWAYDYGSFADAEGHYDFGGLMWLAYLGVAGPDAECLGIIHDDEERMVTLGCNWSTTVQLVAPRRLKTPATLSTDPDVFEGRQLDRFGRAVGFYITRYEEDDIRFTGTDDQFSWVPRQTETGRPLAFHYFEKDQPHAQRGLTRLVTILGRTGPVDTYYNSHIGQAVMRATHAMYVKTEADTETVKEMLAPAPQLNGKSIFDQKVDFYKEARLRIGKPGGGNQRLAVLPPQDEIVFEGMDGVLGDPAPLVNMFLREYASATGTTFSQVSKDFTKDSYMSARAAILDVWRGVVRRRRFFESAVPSPIFGAVIEEAISRGRIQLPATAPDFVLNRYAYTRALWTGPAMPEVDPLKAAQAMEIRLRTRTSNRQIECAERGAFYYDVLSQFGTEIAETKEIAEDLDVDFELEPKKPGEMQGGDQPGEPGDGGQDEGGQAAKEQ